jgi:type IV secretion system protein VirB9
MKGFWVSMLLVVAVHAGAAETPARGLIDARIRVAAYNPEQVYRLIGIVGYQIDLEFETGESYAGIGGGDLEGLTLGAFDNHLLLKPKAVNVGTNLTVFTNRRHYHFDYSASARRSDPGETIYAVRFTYPPAVKSGPSAEERVESGLAQAQSRRPHNIDYWFCGDEAVRPIAASDDGVHTRLTFGAREELPAIFVRNEDQSESLLNFSIEDGDVVVHRVARQFVLRRGKLTGCITNKGYVGSGERLKSGTVAPDVSRARKESP